MTTKVCWFVDDERELLRLLQDVLQTRAAGVRIKYVEHFDQCAPSSGDLVFHDLIGVGKPGYLPGVTYKVCSGSFTDESDFVKPYDFETLANAVMEWAKFS